MKTPYEIWDNDTFNIVYAYATPEEALASVRQEIAVNGVESAASWVLQHEDRVTLENIAHGETFIGLAMSDTPTSHVR